MGEPVKPPRSTSKSIVEICVCGQTFLSHNRFQMHQHENESTKDGRCLRKPRRILVSGKEKISGIQVEQLNLKGDGNGSVEELPGNITLTTPPLTMQELDLENALGLDDDFMLL
jgi:hypothetical protein